MGYDHEKLCADLGALGVEPGDGLFVHSSFKSLGPVAGGAPTVIEALTTAVGPQGLIAMPSFNLIEGGQDERAANWHVETTKSTVGWLTEYFRQMPGTVRSDHYSHAVAARGPEAPELVGEHLSREGMRSPWDQEPWGCTYGTRSPMLKLYRRANGKVLMIGVDYKSSTYCHVVEVMAWNRALESDPEAEYKWIDRETRGAWWDAHGRLNRGKVGDADCRLFGIKDFVDGLLEEVACSPDPEAWRL